MTRVLAIVLSYFGTAIAAAPVLLFFAFFENGVPEAIGWVAVVAFVAMALFVRLYFAVWYARDKNRSGALGLLALLSWLGWLLLIMAEDRKPEAGQPALARNPSIAP